MTLKGINMHINDKRLAVSYGENVTLQFNGWEVSGRVEHLTSDNRVKVDGTYYNLRACRTVASDYDRTFAISTENRIRQEGGVLA